MVNQISDEDICPERLEGAKDLSSNPEIEDSGLAGKDFYPASAGGGGAKDLSPIP